MATQAQKDALVASATAVKALVDALTADAPPAPAPPPPPPAPPPPAPPPPAPAPAIDSRTLDLAKIVEFKAWHQSSRYERDENLLVLSGATGLIPFQGYNLAAGGAPRALLGSTYTLLMSSWDAALGTWNSPVVAASVNVTPGVTLSGTFSVPLASLAHGWYKIDIGGLTSGETATVYFAFVKKTIPAGAQPIIPVVTGSHGMAEALPNNILQWVAAPGAYAPTPKPIMAIRSYATPVSIASRADLHCEQLVLTKWGDIHRPNVNFDGVMSSMDAQAYFWSTLTNEVPLIACLDGPRGVGAVAMATHLMFGTAAPDGIPRNGTYFSDPWRIGKISQDGTITTLVGWRHKNSILGYWEEGALEGMPYTNYKAKALELVGDWSAVPAAVRGFREIWGFAWDKRTLAIDPNSTPVGGEHTHVVGPAMFVADSQRNRVCKVQFNAADRNPPKVTEFLTGLADPWDIVFDVDSIYVSERKAHRIVEYDATTGALRRVVLQGAALATIDANRDVIVSGTLAQRQAEPCVAPEGLYLQDGWLYYASKAQAQVRRVNLTTGAIEVRCAVFLDGNSRFAKIAISDGTFGPRGSAFVCTWSSAMFGYPGMYLPDGTKLPNLGGAGAVPGGTGDWVANLEYASSVAVGQGRMVCAGMSEGLLRVSKTQAGDLAETPAVTRGRTDYLARGFHLLYGQNGFGFHGLPLPWGTSTDIDAYLTFYGHAP